jgi:hypothetical protein
MSRVVTNYSSLGETYVPVLPFGTAGEPIQTNVDRIDLLTNWRCSSGKQGNEWDGVLWSTASYRHGEINVLSHY